MSNHGFSELNPVIKQVAAMIIVSRSKNSNADVLKTEILDYLESLSVYERMMVIDLVFLT